jgi:hypothetical protein
MVTAPPGEKKSPPVIGMCSPSWRGLHDWRFPCRVLRSETTSVDHPPSWSGDSCSSPTAVLIPLVSNKGRRTRKDDFMGLLRILISPHDWIQQAHGCWMLGTKVMGASALRRPPSKDCTHLDLRYPYPVHTREQGSSDISGNNAALISVSDLVFRTHLHSLQTEPEATLHASQRRSIVRHCSWPYDSRGLTILEPHYHGYS